MADKKELLERYEALGEEETYVTARQLYEQAISNGSGGDPATLVDYGYLLYCHGRMAMSLAVEQFRRAIELDPGSDQAHYQLIAADGALGNPEVAIDRYKQAVAESPGEIRWYRHLATAYLAGGKYADARAVIDKGLELAPDDMALIDRRASVKAGTGDAEGALADWRWTLELDRESIGGLYMSAFLLERIGRLEEAKDKWRAIIDWNASRGYELQTAWPSKELERLNRKTQT